MTRCRVPEFCEEHKIDVGICDRKTKRNVPRNVKQLNICVHIQKNSLVCYLEEK